MNVTIKPRRGAQHPLAKLTPEDADRIRATWPALRQMGWTQARLARRFGVSQTAISRLLTGKSYRGNKL